MRYYYTSPWNRDPKASTPRYRQVSIINSPKSATAYGTFYPATQDRAQGSPTFPADIRTDILPHPRQRRRGQKAGPSTEHRIAIHVLMPALPEAFEQKDCKCILHF